jgi:hypothetical protein
MDSLYNLKIRKGYRPVIWEPTDVPPRAWVLDGIQKSSLIPAGWTWVKGEPGAFVTYSESIARYTSQLIDVAIEKRPHER